MNENDRKEPFTLILAIALAFALCMRATKCSGQWLGFTVAEYPSVTTMIEMPVAFTRLSLVTHVNRNDPQFRFRFGLAYAKIPGIELIGYVPQMNMSLKYIGYNTPFGAEARWHLDSDTYRLVLGTDIYTQGQVFYPYFSAFAKFK